MTDYKNLSETLKSNPKTWLVTGAAGFIGSHLAEELVFLNQRVRGLDDFSSGHQGNISSFMDSPDFSFEGGDIRDKAFCQKMTAGVDYVLHHAAIGSVVKSIEEPEFVNSVNNNGFENILQAALSNGVKRVVYASSSAVYGNGTGNIRHEEEPLNPLSPYAETKCENEKLAQTMTRSETMETVGLRYFNIYGPRQDPNGAYAAVIPKWINEMLSGQEVEIFGDGETTRDFCFVEDAVQANIRAALCPLSGSDSPVYNIASGRKTTLNELFEQLKVLSDYQKNAVYRDFRAADIKVSCADISKAGAELAYKPIIGFEEGIRRTFDWYEEQRHG